MRCYPLWFFAALALAGCSFSETDIPLPIHGGHLDGQARNVVVSAHALGHAAEYHDSIDLTSALHSATSIPQRIESLEHTVIVCGIVLTLVGLANAALLLRLLAAPVRDPSPAVPALPDGVAACACGAPISPRTKTGRCRACAREYRAALRVEASARRAVPARTVSLRTPS